jgi:two-component system, OmpR family, KDP operon response regulator KdpE
VSRATFATSPTPVDDTAVETRKDASMIRVLVVDDEPQIRRALSLNLGARGYEVFEAATGEAALTVMATEHPDIALLDLGLPGMDGIMVLEAIRGWSTMPVIVLTVRDDERSKVDALEAGADDYVTKPFGMAELVARIRAVLRRNPESTPDVAEVATAAFRLDLAGHRAYAGPEFEEVRLTPLEWGIVAHLVRNPDRLITYRQLVTAVWGPTYDPDQNLLRVHMGHIRRKLEADPSRPAFFITDPGVGYRFQPAA